MLNILSQVEKELPKLLEDAYDWKSLCIDYHPPKVHRIFRDWGEYRIYLHEIFPCTPEEALFHPHPWPSAMRVLSGEYEMCVGYGKGESIPPVACKMIANVSYLDGFVYEMTDPDGWHSVRPINNSCLTIMVTGKPWDRPSPKPEGKLNPLTPEIFAKMMEFYRDFYPL